MIVNRLQFLDKMKMVFPFIDAKSSLQNCGHECFLFQNGWLSAFNNYTSISIRLSDSFDIDCMVIDAKILKQLFEKMTGEEVTLEYEDFELKVKCGRMQSRIKCIVFDNQDYPYNINNAVDNIHQAINEIEWKNLPDNFFQAISFCTIPDNRNSLAGIYVEEDSMYDWAGHACTWFKLSASMDTVYLPDDRVKSLLKIVGIKKYFTDKSWIYFSTEDNNLIFSIRQITEYNFSSSGIKHAVDLFAKSEGDIFSGFLPDTFSEVLERAFLFTEEKGKMFVIKLNFGEKGITVKAKKNNMEFNESVEWKGGEIKSFEPFECAADMTSLLFGLREKLIFNIFKKDNDANDGTMVFTDNQGKMFCFVQPKLIK